MPARLSSGRRYYAATTRTVVAKARSSPMATSRRRSAVGSSRWVQCSRRGSSMRWVSRLVRMPWPSVAESHQTQAGPPADFNAQLGDWLQLVNRRRRRWAASRSIGSPPTGRRCWRCPPVLRLIRRPRADVVCVGQHLFERETRPPVGPPGQARRRRRTSRARRCPRSPAGRRGTRRVVPVDQAVSDQLTVHRRQGGGPHRVVGRDEPDARHPQQRRIQHAASVLLDERLLVRAPALLPRQAVRSGFYEPGPRTSPS